MTMQTHEGLPETSFYKHNVTGETILIKRGESGYYEQDQLKHRDPDELNEIYEVTKAQAEAMYAGSMWGWHTPASNPKLYNEDGSRNKGVNWRGLEILEHNLVFLVDLKKKEFKQIGSVEEETEEALKPFVDKYWSNLFVDGMYLFIADKLEGNEYEATHRLSHSDVERQEDLREPEELDESFYFDVAESDERVLFSNILNGTTPKEMDL